MESTASSPVSNGHAARPPEDRLPAFLHDLNNLLGIVLGNAELLQDGRDSEEKSRKRLHAIQNAAAKARDLAAALQGHLDDSR